MYTVRTILNNHKLLFMFVHMLALLEIRYHYLFSCQMTEKMGNVFEVINVYNHESRGTFLLLSEVGT